MYLLLCSRGNGDLFTCEDNMLVSREDIMFLPENSPLDNKNEGNKWTESVFTAKFQTF